MTGLQIGVSSGGITLILLMAWFFFAPKRARTAALAGGVLPQHSDSLLAFWAARTIYAGLLESGVSIYLYKPRMLHAKTMVVDGDFGCIGTANLDYVGAFS